MNQCDRIKLIITENKLKQKEFAASVDVTESYISKLTKDPDINISSHLLSLIEERYGYNPEWIVSGTEPKYKTISKHEGLTDKHKRLIAELEKMPEDELIAIEAFMDSLESIKKGIKK